MSDTATIAAAAGAGVLLIAAFLWRQRARRRAAHTVRRMLASPDPMVRRSALGAIGAHGLRRHADVLLSRIGEETEPEVLHTLATTVMRNLWEPADSPSLVALRAWAQQHLADRQLPESENRAVPLAGGPGPVAVVSAVEAALGEPVLALRLDGPGETIRWSRAAYAGEEGRLEHGARQ
jgi:hypothetical protein